MKPLASHHVLITAGPTWEPIDPVRFLSNRSSGQLGYAMAAAARAMGARVTLVSGPTALTAPKGVRRLSVVTAREMYRATLAAAKDADIIICAAAVADWRPVRVARRKMKKPVDPGLGTRDSRPTAVSHGSRVPCPGSRVPCHESVLIELVPNPDILATLGRRKRKNQFLVGFALESERLLENAWEKLRRKRCDCIVANPVPAIGAAQHQATVLFPSGKIVKFPPLSKIALARRLIYLLHPSQR